MSNTPKLVRGDGSKSSMHFNVASPSSGLPPIHPTGQISFVPRSSEPANFWIVHDSMLAKEKSNQVAHFVNEFLKTVPEPEVILSITGSAFDFTMRLSKLDQIFRRGLLRAAQNTKAWIITGGSDCGVMKFVGEAMRGQDQDEQKVPCIGIAAFSKITRKELLDTQLHQQQFQSYQQQQLPQQHQPIEYSPDKPNDRDSAALNPDHTHFILVKTEKDDWGAEIPFRTELEDIIRKIIPLVLVAVNGGPGTIETVVEGSAKGFPIIIVDGSGRASDALAAYIKQYRKESLSSASTPNSQNSPNASSNFEWEHFFADICKFKNNKEKETFQANLDIVRKNDKLITIFNPNEGETEDMDKAILHSIFSCQQGYNDLLERKLHLGVSWGRTDVLEELLQQYDTVKPDEKSHALSKALYESLIGDKPEIFELLVSRGAGLEKVTMHDLYLNGSINSPQIRQIMAFVGMRAGVVWQNQNSANDSMGGNELKVVRDRNSSDATEQSHLLNNILRLSQSLQKQNPIEVILKAIDPIFAKTLTDENKTYTDVLIWAILVDRFDLAKAIWRHTTYTVHSALVACHIYRALEGWFQTGEHKVQRLWFENAAVGVISAMPYESAKKVLSWKWAELNKDTLHIADRANCKLFFSVPHVQRFLDEKFHSCPAQNVKVEQGTKIWKIFVMLFTFAHFNFGAFGYIKSNDKQPPPKSSLYTIPFIKLLVHTISYIVFISFLTANLMLVNPQAQDRFAIHWYEWAMWIWMFAWLLEEFTQYLKDRNEHFVSISNKMDLTVYVLLVLYLVTRIMAWGLESQTWLYIFTDILILATVASFVQLMNVFAISHTLGPLFFVIVRLFKDVNRWLFIFSLFMISSQAGIYAFTRQVGQSGWTLYPQGSMGAGFTAILGDLGDYTMTWMTETPFGVGVVVVILYSLVTQIMLVNLLIAMMGNSYSKVKDTSDKQWKFYRYRLIKDYDTSSACPPPFNILYIMFIFVYRKVATNTTNHETAGISQKAIVDNLKKATESACEEILAVEKATFPSISDSIHERIRILATQRDSDRSYLEQELKKVEERANKYDEKAKEIIEKQQQMDRKIEEILDILRSRHI